MKPTLRSFFSIGAALREHLGRGLEREELRERGERGRGADRLEEGAARGVLRETSRASRRRRPRPRSACLSLSTGAHCSCGLRVGRARPGSRAARMRSPSGSAGAWDRTDCRKSTSARAPSLRRRVKRRGVTTMILQWPCQSRRGGILPRQFSLLLCVQIRRTSAPLSRQMPKFSSRLLKKKAATLRSAAANQLQPEIVRRLLRHDAVAADVDAAGLQRAVRLLGRGQHGEIARRA